MPQLEQEPWRQEVASRVRQHRARRRRNGDSSASLAFEFDDPSIAASAPADPLSAETRLEAPKVIAFPRPPIIVQAAARNPVEELELADPVPETPRILDAADPVVAGRPEQLDFLTDFADLRLDAREIRAAEPLELPPCPAPLLLRFIAGMVDSAIVLAGELIFVAVFFAVLHSHGVSRATWLGLLAGAAVLWLGYQYLFLVHGRGTLGMQFMQLELTTFNQGCASRSKRLARALASTLSALSLGLGFAWAFVDEDTLCWHDRISQTHLRQPGPAGPTIRDQLV